MARIPRHRRLVRAVERTPPLADPLWSRRASDFATHPPLPTPRERLHRQEEDEEGENEDSDDEEEEDNEGDDFADMSREELLELWGVLRRLGWFSLLQDAFSGVMFSHVLAYVKRRRGTLFFFFFFFSFTGNNFLYRPSPARSTCIDSM